MKISNFYELRPFIKEYTYKHPALPVDIQSTVYINWTAVAAKYPGIEINPYIKEARMLDETEWYYLWDVASGCVWNESAIRVKLIYEYKDGGFQEVVGTPKYVTR